MKVPLLDLTLQYKTIAADCERVIREVVESQRFILGPQVDKLEEEIASYCGARYGVGVTSGTDALLIALMALDIGPGDEVITSPYTFFASAGSVARVGAKPVFVDIERDSYNLDPRALERAITPRTKAIMPVHLFGRCVEMEPIMALAKKRGLAIIEDAAQAIGAEYQGKRAGSMGTVGCFSFFPSKNLGCFGDGGLVTTDDKALADKLKILRNHGSNPKYYHGLIGGNFRLDALQAAVLRVKLPKLEAWHRARIANAHRYMELFRLAGLVGKADSPVTLPPEGTHRHIFNQFCCRYQRRDELRTYLDKHEIGCEIYYPVSLHEQRCFANLGYHTGDFPESERAAKETLALPIFPELVDAQLAYVVDTIAAFYRAG